MKARRFFEQMRMYPDLNVKIVVKVGDKFVDIRDLSCDLNNGDLIIYLKENKEDKNA